MFKNILPVIFISLFMISCATPNGGMKSNHNIKFRDVDFNIVHKETPEMFENREFYNKVISKSMISFQYTNSIIQIDDDGKWFYADKDSGLILSLSDGIIKTNSNECPSIIVQKGLNSVRAFGSRVHAQSNQKLEIFDLQTCSRVFEVNSGGQNLISWENHYLLYKNNLFKIFNIFESQPFIKGGLMYPVVGAAGKGRYVYFVDSMKALLGFDTETKKFIYKKRLASLPLSFGFKGDWLEIKYFKKVERYPLNENGSLGTPLVYDESIISENSHAYYKNSAFHYYQGDDVSVVHSDIIVNKFYEFSKSFIIQTGEGVFAIEKELSFEKSIILGWKMMTCRHDNVVVIKDVDGEYKEINMAGQVSKASIPESCEPSADIFKSGKIFVKGKPVYDFASLVNPDKKLYKRELGEKVYYFFGQ